ncbi:MAG: permease-like cell division protein FtsX [Elusimicrobiota bacterium]|nr:MAG: permease-like cell division protein FtsX [Elusimicrobiota bacterium]
MGAKARSAWIFALAAAAGLAGETLLLAESHVSRLEESLRDDFRVVFFARPSLDASRAKVLEEKLRAFPEAADVRFVPADDALAALKREDPELAESVALVGDNPLPSAFEVRPAAEAFTRLGAWLDEARGLAEWSDVRWKPGQVQAILRLRFYSRLLRVTLSTLLCLGAGLALAALAGAAKSGAGRRGLSAWAGLGGAAGLLAAVAIAWPLRRDELLWAWPATGAQLALIAGCATIGWSLSLWRAES